MSPRGVAAAARATSTGRGVARDVVAIAVAAAAALALVLPYYTRRPFWFDELVSLEIARLGARPFLDYVFTVESNMALYHAVLGQWQAVGGDEVSVRALSIVFALGALPYLYALALALFDRRTAVIATVLMSVNVSYVGYARDARSYALALLLVTASAYYLVRAVERSRSRDWALYAVTAALAVWAHLFAGLVVAVQLLWLVLERGRVRRRQALAAVAGIAALLLPIALAVAVSRQGTQLDWLQRPRFRQLPGLFEWFVESPATLALYFVGAVVGLAAGAAERRRLRRSALLVLWILVPPLVAFAASYATPVYLYRYFLVCLPALVVLVAAGFARLRPEWLGLGLAAAAVVLSVRTVVTCQPDCKIRHDDWEAAAAYIDARSQSNDGIVFYPAQVRTPVAHYLARDRPSLLFPERWALIGEGREGSTSVETAIRRVDGHPRVWLVTWWLPSERARDALAGRARLLMAQQFAGNVHVELYRP